MSRDQQVWRREGSRFLVLRSEMAQLFDYNEHTTMVCAALCSWHTGAVNENERRGKVDAEPWVFLSKPLLRKSCLGWVSVRKMDDAVEELERRGILTINRDRKNQTKGRLGYLLNVEKLNAMLQLLPDVDVPSPRRKKEIQSCTCAVLENSQSCTGAALKTVQSCTGAGQSCTGAGSSIEESIEEKKTPTPLPPPSNFETQFDPKVLRWRFKDATRKQLPPAAVREAEQIAQSRGAGTVHAIAEQFVAHFRSKMSSGEDPANPVPYFLGCLRRWEGPEDSAPAVTREKEPIVTPAPSSAQPEVPQPKQTSQVEEFLRDWNAGPCADLRVVVVTTALRSGLEDCLRSEQFRSHQPEIIRRAHALRSKSPEKDWLTLATLVTKERWGKLLNGDYDFASGQGRQMSKGERIRKLAQQRWAAEDAAKKQVTSAT